MKRSMLLLCLPLATFALGCGPAGQQFHGSYTGSNTYTMTINGVSNDTKSVPASYRISEGVESDIILIDSTGSCALPADVEGDVATLKGGTTCTYVTQGGITATETLTAGTAVITGSSLQLNLSSTVSVTINGQTFPGSYVQNMSLKRIGK